MIKKLKINILKKNIFHYFNYQHNLDYELIKFFKREYIIYKNNHNLKSFLSKKDFKL